MCAAEILSRYRDESSSNLPAENLDFMAFDKPFDQLHAYSHFDY